MIDGDTLFFDRNLNIIKRVSPKKNRNQYCFHQIYYTLISNPIKSKKRIVVNTIFKMEKNDYRIKNQT